MKSQETKQKMSQAAKERSNTPEYKEAFKKNVLGNRRSSITRWANIDEDKVVELYGTMPVTKMAEVLCVPVTTLRRRIQYLKSFGLIGQNE